MFHKEFVVFVTRLSLPFITSICGSLGGNFSKVYFYSFELYMIDRSQYNTTEVSYTTEAKLLLKLKTTQWMKVGLISVHFVFHHY